jgi:hypothetical protein
VQTAVLVIDRCPSQLWIARESIGGVAVAAETGDEAWLPNYQHLDASVR